MNPYAMQVAAALLLLFLLVAPPAWAAAEGEASAEQDVQPAVDAMEVVEDAASRPAPSANSGDPWEGMNRKVFAFNEGLDRWILEPVATGWDYVLPEFAQDGISNFFDNLSMPVHLANDLLQGKPGDAYQTAWRMVINTTVGIGGLFDPASRWEVYKSDEDFGQTLGVWGVPSGPYLVIPLLGPSSPRDATGLVVDQMGAAATYFVPLYVTVSAGAVDRLNDRARLLETIAAEREAAFDFYTALRSSYTQFRENRVRDRKEEETDDGDDDLYYFDEEDEDG